MRHGLRRMGLRGWPESSLSGVAHRAQMWEGDEGMSIWAEASGRVAEGVRTDWMRSAQSSKSAGNDGSNMKSGIDSAWVGSKAGVWSRRKSPWGGPRAGEIGGRAWGSSRCSRMAKTTGGSVRKARIFIWPPHAGHRSGITS